MRKKNFNNIVGINVFFFFLWSIFFCFSAIAHSPDRRRVLLSGPRGSEGGHGDFADVCADGRVAETAAEAPARCSGGGSSGGDDDDATAVDRWRSSSSRRRRRQPRGPGHRHPPALLLLRLLLKLLERRSHVALLERQFCRRELRFSPLFFVFCVSALSLFLVKKKQSGNRSSSSSRASSSPFFSQNERKKTTSTSSPPPEKKKKKQCSCPRPSPPSSPRRPSRSALAAVPPRGTFHDKSDHEALPLVARAGLEDRRRCSIFALFCSLSCLLFAPSLSFASAFFPFLF